MQFNSNTKSYVISYENKVVNYNNVLQELYHIPSIEFFSQLDLKKIYRVRKPLNLIDSTCAEHGSNCSNNSLPLSISTIRPSPSSPSSLSHSGRMTISLSSSEIFSKIFQLPCVKIDPPPRVKIFRTFCNCTDHEPMKCKYI